jgi:molecular chaperone DnaJ
VLCDPQKRAAYDRYGHAGVSGVGAGGFDPNAFAGFEDIFGSLGDLFGFGDMFGGRRRRGGPQRGSDLRYDLEISFEESYGGTEPTIQIPREETCETCKGSGASAGSAPEVCGHCRGTGQLRFQQGFLTVARPCGTCHGSGKVIARPCQACRGAGRVGRERKITVKIPPGIATGQRLRLYGEGEHGTAGGPAGDLYVVVHVQEHQFFHREGDDLYCEMPVTYPTLALGGDVRVPLVNGEDTIKVSAGTQPGARFKLRGKGMPNVSGRGHGDLYVVARVAVPKKLTREQRRLLEELAATMPVEPAEADGDGADKPFFEKVKDIFG